jgi:hypothetical protein
MHLNDKPYAAVLCQVMQTYAYILLCGAQQLCTPLERFFPALISTDLVKT